jgi:hypothetical protein
MLTTAKNKSDEAMKPLTLHRIASSLYRFYCPALLMAHISSTDENKITVGLILFMVKGCCMECIIVLSSLRIWQSHYGNDQWLYYNVVVFH